MEKKAASQAKQSCCTTIGASNDVDVVDVVNVVFVMKRKKGSARLFLRFL